MPPILRTLLGRGEVGIALQMLQQLTGMNALMSLG